MHLVSYFVARETPFRITSRFACKAFDFFLLLLFLSPHWIVISNTFCCCCIFLCLIYRKIHHMLRVHSVLKSISLPNTHSNRQKYASKRKFIIQTSMKRAKCVCQLLARKIGNQPPKRIRVMLMPLKSPYSFCKSIAFSMFFCLPDSYSSIDYIGQLSRAGASVARWFGWRISQRSRTIHKKCGRIYAEIWWKTTERSLNSPFNKLN